MREGIILERLNGISEHIQPLKKGVGQYLDRNKTS